MNFIRLLFLLLVAFPATVLARLGESETELIARFGDPVSKTKEAAIVQGEEVVFGTRYSFREGRWTMTCSLVEDRCARISYSYPGEWGEEQFSLFLSRNSQGLEWTDVTKPAAKKIMRAWDRTDSGTASWSGNAMTVVAPAYVRAKESAEAKAKAEALRKERG